MPAAAIFDLDRTLIAGSTAPIFTKHLVEAGVAEDRKIPFAGALQSLFGAVGESRLMMQPARLAVRASSGWSVPQVREACTHAAREVADQLQPFAKALIDEHRQAGRTLVLASTSPEPFVGTLAEELGFDAAVCTKWTSDGDLFTGVLDGPFIWGPQKAAAVEAWAAENDVRLDQSYAYSDSYFDAPLLDLVGHPVAVNPDVRLAATAALKGWPTRHLDKSEGIIKVAGREVQEWTRPLMRPGLVAPYADIEIQGVEKIPPSGPAIVVFNHRSYFDPTVMGLLFAKAGRNLRALGKKEVFDIPVVGRLMRGMGGVRVERASGSDEPLKAAAKALNGGEMVMIAPEGTIPRGPAFFDPELKGRWGAARLAAETRAPVIPVGLWGTEKVWPRNQRLPNVDPRHRPVVTAVVGDPVELDYSSADDDTKRIMTAIADLLPAEARRRHTPTEEELMRTFPPGYKGDPNAETQRRPGTDT